RSASDSRPFGPSKTYCLVSASHGSARRAAASLSPSRRCRFSFASSFLRARVHWSLVTTLLRISVLLAGPCAEGLSGFEVSLQACQHARPAFADRAVHLGSRLELVVRHRELHHVGERLDIEGDARALRGLVGKCPADHQAV